MKPAPAHSLRIRDLSLRVHLGWPAEERTEPQEVRVRLELRYFTAPEGAATDDLSGTLCYARICEAFAAYAAAHEFRLVEKLAQDLYSIAKEIAGERALLALSLHKVQPPVNGLLGGVEYRVGDFP